MPHWSRRQALSRLPRELAATAAAVAVLLTAQIACAQSVDPENRTAFLSSVAATTTTTAVVGVIVTLVLPNDAVALERYLRNNAVAVQQDISRGGGPVVDDLADIFDVPPTDRPAFGRLLRQRRRLLLQLAAYDTLSTSTAAQFAALVTVDVRRARELARSEFEPSSGTGHLPELTPEVPEA